MRRAGLAGRCRSIGTSLCVALLLSVSACALVPGTGDADAAWQMRAELAAAAVAEFPIVSELLEAPLVVASGAVRGRAAPLGPPQVAVEVFGSFVADFPIGADDVVNVMRRLGYASVDGWQDLPTELVSSWDKDDGSEYSVKLSKDGDWMTLTLSNELQVWGDPDELGLTTTEVPLLVPMDGSAGDVIAARSAVVEALATPPVRVKAALALKGDYDRAEVETVRADSVVTSSNYSVVAVEATLTGATCDPLVADKPGLKGFTRVQTQAGGPAFVNRDRTVVVECVINLGQSGQVVFRPPRPIRVGAEIPDGLLVTEEVRLG